MTCLIINTHRTQRAFLCTTILYMLCFMYIWLTPFTHMRFGRYIYNSRTRIASRASPSQLSNFRESARRSAAFDPPHTRHMRTSRVIRRCMDVAERSHTHTRAFSTCARFIRATEETLHASLAQYSALQVFLRDCRKTSNVGHKLNEIIRN